LATDESAFSKIIHQIESTTRRVAEKVCKPCTDDVLGGFVSMKKRSLQQGSSRRVVDKAMWPTILAKVRTADTPGDSRQFIASRATGVLLQNQLFPKLSR
jgi:hypothetical protein